jgi:tRNA dimethylallyltransferase
MNLIPIRPIIIIGPTGSGKTALAHSMFEEMASQGTPCEIVNLDSFQIYRGLDIGTAKPSRSEQIQYHYHGLDLCELTEHMDAHVFSDRMTHICQDITARQKQPLCVGGSGLYLRAFLHGLDAFPKRDDAVRAHIRAKASQEGWPACHAWLATVDPTRAKELHPNDKTRIERALEIFLTTGIPMGEQCQKTQTLSMQPARFESHIIHVEPPTDYLKERIARRVGTMFENGWLEEVAALVDKYKERIFEFHGIKAIGYKDIAHYILGDSPYKNKEELMEHIRAQTWQYARRQLTWNAKEKKDGVWSPYPSSLT